MGTNYYARRSHVEGHGAVVSVEHESLHIGKSSAGWCFSLHVIPEKGLNNLDDWLKLLWGGDYTVVDEYGNELSHTEIEQIIMCRKGRVELSEAWNNPAYKLLFGHSYLSLQDYLDRNQAVEGPNNLLRHKVDGYHCIGHGEGTWDYIVGEFC